MITFNFDTQVHLVDNRNCNSVLCKTVNAKLLLVVFSYLNPT